MVPWCAMGTVEGDVRRTLLLPETLECLKRALRGEQVTEPSSGHRRTGQERKASCVLVNFISYTQPVSEIWWEGDLVPEAREKGSRIHSSTFLDPPLEKTILRGSSLVNTHNSLPACTQGTE